MRRPLSVIAPICCAYLFWLPAIGHSEEVEAESIEWAVADSDRVVIGNVVKVETVKGDNGETFEVATVAVCRSLSGPHTKRVTFLLHNFRGPLAKKWMQAEVSLLFFLIQGKRVDTRILPLAAKFDWCLREDGMDQNAYCLTRKQVGMRRTVPVITREYRILRDPSEILKRVEQVIGRLPHGRRLEMLLVEVPNGTEAFKGLNDDSSVFLAVPDERQIKETEHVQD